MRIKLPNSMKEHYRNPGQRELVMRFNGGKEPTLYDYNTTYRFIKSLAQTVGHRRRTVLRGLGVFEWKPWVSHTPTRKRVRSWRLTFKLTNAERKYHGGRDQD